MMLFCAVGSYVLWTVAPTIEVWAFRIGFGLGIIACCLLWYYYAPPRETLPDLLARRARFDRYFECDGLCFWPVVEPAQGICWVAIYFQNRYARECNCQVQILAPLKSFWFGRHDLPPIKADVICPGGAFGVCRVPVAVPERFRDRRLRFGLFGKNDYPMGKGEMVRFREGIPAQYGGPPRAYSDGRAACKLSMPFKVASELPLSIKPITEILWQPDLPTKAFPVIPMTPASPPREISLPVNPQGLP